MKQRSPNSTLEIWQSPFKGLNPGLQTQIPPRQMAPPLQEVDWPLVETPQWVPGIPKGEVGVSGKFLEFEVSRCEGGPTAKTEDADDFGGETNLGNEWTRQFGLKIFL